MLTIAQIREQTMERFRQRDLGRPVEPLPERDPLGEARIPGRIDGLQGREAGYAFAGWQRLGFDWEREGVEALGGLIQGAVRHLWVWSSKPGTGKTGFAVVAARQWARERGSNVFVLRMPQIGTMDFKERDALAREAATHRLVVIDDFHRLRFSVEHNLDWLHAFLDGLYVARCATLVTANASFESVKNVACKSSPDYAAGFDRLRDGGHLSVQATGESRRA